MFDKYIEDRHDYKKGKASDSKIAPHYVRNGKRPFVSWKMWDIASQKYVRQKIETSDEDRVKEIIATVQYYHIEGYVVDCSIVSKSSKSAMTITTALRFFLQEKAHLKSLKNYRSRVKVFQEWLNEQGYAKMDVKAFGSDHIKEFINYSRTAGNATRELNNKRVFLNSVFLFFLEESIVSDNPAKFVKKLKDEEKQRATFAPKLLRRMWAEWEGEQQELLWASRFMFYSFMRPREMVGLRMADLDFKTRTITVRAEISKTGLGYVKITPPLYKLLVEMGVTERNDGGFVFQGIEDRQVPVARWTSRFREYRKKMKMSKTLVFYCFKHTGVREHFLAGNNLLWIMEQCRHKDLATTLHYLQTGLGLRAMNDFEYHEPAIYNETT